MLRSWHTERAIEMKGDTTDCRSQVRTNPSATGAVAALPLVPGDVVGAHRHTVRRASHTRIQLGKRSASFLVCNQLDAGKPAALKTSASTVSLRYFVRVNKRSHSDETGKSWRVNTGRRRLSGVRPKRTYGLGRAPFLSPLASPLPAGRVLRMQTPQTQQSVDRASRRRGIPQRRLRSLQPSARRA